MKSNLTMWLRKFRTAARHEAWLHDRCQCGGHWVNREPFMVPRELVCERCRKEKPKTERQLQESEAVGFLHGV